MGLLISRFRAKKSTIEVLEDIDKDINRLQKNRKQNQERQKKIVTSLLIYSIAAYVLSAIIFFVYYFPETWKLRFLYSLPLLIFPLLIWSLKKLLHWYFVKRIASNDGELLTLRERKKQILEDVMETETYKKAKEILEKFDPVRFRKLEALPDAATSPSVSGTPGTAIHQRSRAIQPAASRSGLAQQQRQMTSRTPMSTPRMPVPKPRPMPTPSPVKTSTPYPVTPNLPPRPRQPGGQPPSAGPRQQQPLGSAIRQPLQQPPAMMGNTPMGPRGYAMPPGPPMPRTILPQKRGTMDRLMDYLVGDGPENRYALICQQCFSHNGMALKEEFEYLAFRCCYCYYLNPAKKQRPMAPRLEFFAPRGRNMNTDSQCSAASDEESDDEEDDDSREEDSANGRATKQSDNRTPARQIVSNPEFGRGRGGPSKDGCVGRLSQGSVIPEAGNSSSNALTAPRDSKQPGSLARPGQQQQKHRLSRPTQAPQGQQKLSGSSAGDTRSDKKEGIDRKPENLISSSVATEKQGQSTKKTGHTQEKSNIVENSTEPLLNKADAVNTSDSSFVDNNEGTDFVIIPSAAQANRGGESDIPFIDGDVQLISPLPKSLDNQSKDGLLSAASATTAENQTEGFTSLASESEVDSSDFASISAEGNADNYHSGEVGEREESGDSLPDGVQGRMHTLSEEIRDSVKSLLSPSTVAVDDRNGGSAEYSDQAVSSNGDSQVSDSSKTKTPE